MLNDTDTTAVWTACSSFNDLCAAMIRFVRAELSFCPGRGGPPDPETDATRAKLVSLNETGLLTMCSQPGIAERAIVQRAFVDGFVRKDQALILAEKGLYADIYLEVFAPEWGAAGARIPITQSDGYPFSWGGDVDVGAVQHFAEVCGFRAIAELTEAWQFSAIDLRWGRADHLWNVLREARRPGFSSRPHPDLGLDSEI